MDFTKEEANIIYEDRTMDLDSSLLVEGSDDEENQQELEEMLYSKVYFDNSSIEETSEKQLVSPVVSVNVKTIGEEKPLPPIGVDSTGLNDHDSNSKRPRFIQGCSRSEFNHPTRTTVSRYYDVNQDVSNANPIFVAPSSPGQKRRNPSKASAPSPLTTKLLARSANERTYLSSPVHGGKGVIEATVDVDPGNLSAANWSSPQKSTPRDKNVSQRLDQVKDKMSTGPGIQSPALPVKTAISSKESDSTALKVADEKHQKKIDQSTPVSTGKKSKSLSFEAKVSKVLSSMLDEESRSSIEENQSTSMCINHNSMSESGWSVGMSWADISSKYSFEVDSIEEESVSSLQLQESSIAADSRTSTPDIQTARGNRGEDNEPSQYNSKLKDIVKASSSKQSDPCDTDLESGVGSAVEVGPHENEDNEVNEPSRYNLKLKDKVKESNSKQTDQCDTDSESEVGSVVEVAPPVKPTPPLVDVSDGEYTPVNEAKNSNQTTHGHAISEITLTDHIVDVSSDDDLIILEDLSTVSRATNASAQKAQRRQSDQSKRRLISEEDVPLNKRLSYRKDKDPEITQEEENFLELGKSLVNKSIKPIAEVVKPREKPSKMNRLEQWLHNPIKASKYLDHEKYLKKMSGDPRLWELCWADKNQIRTPRGAKCTNCNHFGHKTHACRVPQKIIVCHMCGVPGHKETRCTNKMCLKCGTKNNVFTDRCKKCVSNSTLCKICNARTHDWQTCPDLWRRYHLTTSRGDLSKPIAEEVRPRSERWCSNCAGNGHWSHECRERYWKCESISPFIKSYETVSAEEEKCDGLSSFAIMLSSEAVQLLNSTDGIEFLKCISKECKVTIHASLDIAFSKLNVTGPTVVVEEVRSKVRDWVQTQTVNANLSKEVAETEAHEESSSDISLSLDESTGAEVQNKLSTARIAPKGASPTAAKTTNRTAWNLPVSFPMEHLKLAKILNEELMILDSPLQCNQTVRQLYKMMSNPLSETENARKKERRRLIRILTIILVGQCGFRDGKMHVDALKSLVARLRAKKGNIRALSKMVHKHYDPIFAGCDRNDLKELVNQFYANENFVQLFDSKNAQIEVDYPVGSQTDLVPVRSPQIQISRVQKSSSSKGPNNKEMSKKDSQSTLKVETIGTQKTQAENDSKKDLIVVTLQKRMKQCAQTVIENLSSRFIFSKDRAKLEKMYKLLSLDSGQGKEKKLLLLSMKTLIHKLGSVYSIKLPKSGK